MPPDRMPNLSSRQLRAVLAVAEYRSFIAAATSLRVSQPALTRTIKQVEATLGVQLFSRSTRQVAVTDPGKEFAALADRVLNDLKIGIESVRGLTDEPRGQIIVSSVLSLANAVLPSLIADHGRKFPGIEIHLREGFHAMIRDEVRSGVADFGIGYIDGLPDLFVAEELGIETVHVVLPADSPLARRKKVELNALIGAPVVSFPVDSRTRRVVDAAAAGAGFALRYTMTVNRLPTLLGLVRNRVGLAVVPSSERPSARDPDLVSRPLIGERLACRIGIMRLRDRELSAAAAEFMRVVRKGLRTIWRAPARKAIRPA